MSTSHAKGKCHDRTTGPAHRLPDRSQDHRRPLTVADLGRLRVTDHAVERYVERVRPALDFDQGKLELLRLLPSSGIIHTERPEWIKEPPVWATDHPGHSGEECWVELGETGIAVVVIRRAVVTVLCRSEFSKEGRQSRNEQRRAERKKRRTERGMEAWLGSASTRWN